jgi:tetratricopeptide (TPR) repeat protein
MAAEPVPPTVRANYASYLLPLGRAGEAIEQARLALESDPLSMLCHLLMVGSLTFAGQYREAIECVRRAMEIDADFYPLWSNLGVAQMAAGFAQEAITSFQRLVELAPWLSDGAWALAAAYHMAGDRERSREWAGKAAGSGGTVFFMAYYYAATREADAMFEALERAYRQRDLYLPVIPSHPLFDVFDPYRADLRFQSLLWRMNLA